MYDYLNTVTPDNDVTLDIPSQEVVIEEAEKYDEVHVGDDGSEERIVLGVDGISVFYVILSFYTISESDAGTIIDFYHNSSKGNGRAKSFKWINYSEPSARRHTYVVRFDSTVPRSIKLPVIHGLTNIRLKVLGKILD